jgi:OmpR-family two-component system manganese-sensing response regulator
MARALLVEDDEAIAAVAKVLLEQDRHVVDLCTTGKDAEQLLRSIDYDILILDWGLPDTTGVEICRDYRRAGGMAPILFLTARSSMRDKALTLGDGADDHLTKPFELKELSLRVNVLLRRPRQRVHSVLKAGDLELDWIKHTVQKDSKIVPLPPTEFQLLEFFFRRPNQCFSQEALLSNVWSMDSEATIEAVKATIKRLRHKIDPEQRLLRTVYGVGYIFDTMGETAARTDLSSVVLVLPTAQS